MDKITEELIKTYAKNQKVDKKVVSKLSNFALSYIYYILAEANQIAEFQQAQNIEGDHVKIAIKSINKKTNLLRRPEAKKLSQEQFKGVKNHNLNSDFSLLNTKT